MFLLPTLSLDLLAVSHPGAAGSLRMVKGGSEVDSASL